MKFEIEEYAKENLNRVKVTSTKQITATCPWCEKHGSFYIDIKTGNYICFKCDERGLRLVGVVAQVEGISWQEAQRFIFKKQVTFRRKETTASLLDKIRAIRGREVDDTHDEVDFPLPKEFIPVHKNGKWKIPIYLKERGVVRKTAKAWNLGYCNRGRYAGRIIIPIECPNGRSFEARAVDASKKPKTLGPSGADKARLLMGWNQAEPNSDLVLVEGPFDALKVSQCGLPVMALMGKVLHPAQFSLLCRRPADSAVVVMLDPEELEAPYAAAAQLLCYFESVFVAKLPPGTDPGDASKRQIFDAFNAAKEYGGERGLSLRARVSASKTKIAETYR